MNKPHRKAWDPHQELRDVAVEVGLAICWFVIVWYTWPTSRTKINRAVAAIGTRNLTKDDKENLRIYRVGFTIAWTLFVGAILFGAGFGVYVWFFE